MSSAPAASSVVGNEKNSTLSVRRGGGNFIEIYNAIGVKGAALRTLGVWAFHGGKDNVVLLNESEKMIADLKKFGHPNPKLTVYPEVLHDS